jgi:hypothetical protein
MNLLRKTIAWLSLLCLCALCQCKKPTPERSELVQRNDDTSKPERTS